MKDLFGQAILDFQTGNSPEPLLTETTISEPDEMPVDYLFRSFAQMPKLEQKALKLARGRVLDIGCGAGSHALWLQENSLDVIAVDSSSQAIKACNLRGVKQTIVSTLLDFKPNQQFDTLLLLMNGTGLFGTLRQTAAHLQHLKQLMAPQGQILIDSSDIIYMFDKDSDGGYWIPDTGYYGELNFTVHYKKQSQTFPWLYLDYATLQTAANANGLNCQLVLKGHHFDYLARLTHL